MSDEKYSAKKHTLTHVFEEVPENIVWDKNKIPDVNELLTSNSPVHSGLMSAADKEILDELNLGGLGITVKEIDGTPTVNTVNQIIDRI